MGSSSDVSSYKGTNPMGSGPYPYNLNYFLILHIVTLKVKDSKHVEFSL